MNSKRQIKKSIFIFHLNFRISNNISTLRAEHVITDFVHNLKFKYQFYSNYKSKYKSYWNPSFRDVVVSKIIMKYWLHEWFFCDSIFPSSFGVYMYLKCKILWRLQYIIQIRIILVFISFFHLPETTIYWLVCIWKFLINEY